MRPWPGAAATSGGRHVFRSAVVAIFCLLILPSHVHAQDAPATAPPPPPPKVEASGDFAFVGTSGNSSTHSIGLGAEYIRRPTNWEIRSKVAYIRNDSDSELTAESTAFLFRAARTVTERLSWFGEYDFLRDRFAGISARNDVVGGLSYLVVTTPRHSLSTNVGVGYSNEQRLAGDNLSTAIWTAGEAYKFKLSETAEITDDFNFNESLSNAGDWRIDHVVAVSAKLTSLLSLKVSNTVRYVHEPVVDFEPTDTITAIALVVRFKK
jgi:putative salt-induced outer membrane protein YdiY